jgi:membrane protein YqaA with SNARE-associated domain
MRNLILLFFIVYFLNLVPAFAPPTWMVFSFIGFTSTSRNVVLLAVVGALAATLGRMTLAKMSHKIIRQRFMTQSARENIDTIRERLERRRKLTFGAFLFYAFTPLPSNYLFIAYGLTGMELWIAATPFFIGRSISYSFWDITSSAIARRLPFNSSGVLSYMTAYFVVTQILLLSLVYVFTRIDWRALLNERKLRWLRKETGRTRA